MEERKSQDSQGLLRSVGVSQDTGGESSLGMKMMLGQIDEEMTGDTIDIKEN
jgi:hypothetical protein